MKEIDFLIKSETCVFCKNQTKPPKLYKYISAYISSSLRLCENCNVLQEYMDMGIVFVKSNDFENIKCWLTYSITDVKPFDYQLIFSSLNNNLKFEISLIQTSDKPIKLSPDYAQKIIQQQIDTQILK